MAIQKNNILLKGLQQRVSHPRLTEPAPTAEELQQAYAAAYRSPDHAWLRPWRFLECRGVEREALGELLASGMVVSQPDIADAQLEKLKQGPLRAPLVIVCYAKLTEHPKVPFIEQLLSVGCAVNNLSSALYALGYGSVWRTGDAAYSSDVHKQLKFGSDEVIVGYLYIGTSMAEDKAIPELNDADYVKSLSDHLKSE